MWRGPNHNGIIESWVDSNQYYWKCLSSESIWIEILGSHLSRESIWIKFQKEFRVMSWFESILESHVSHELSQNQNFLRLSSIKSKKNEPYPCLSMVSIFSQRNPDDTLSGAPASFREARLGNWVLIEAPHTWCQHTRRCSAWSIFVHRNAHFPAGHLFHHCNAQTIKYHILILGVCGFPSVHK